MCVLLLLILLLVSPSFCYVQNQIEFIQSESLYTVSVYWGYNWTVALNKECFFLAKVYPYNYNPQQDPISVLTLRWVSSPSLGAVFDRKIYFQGWSGNETELVSEYGHGLPTNMPGERYYYENVNVYNDGNGDNMRATDGSEPPILPSNILTANVKNKWPHGAAEELAPLNVTVQADPTYPSAYKFTIQARANLLDTLQQPTNVFHALDCVYYTQNQTIGGRQYGPTVIKCDSEDSVFLDNPGPSVRVEISNVVREYPGYGVLLLQEEPETAEDFVYSKAGTITTFSQAKSGAVTPYVYMPPSPTTSVPTTAAPPTTPPPTFNMNRRRRIPPGALPSRIANSRRFSADPEHIRMRRAMMANVLMGSPVLCSSGCQDQRLAQSFENTTPEVVFMDPTLTVLLPVSGSGSGGYYQQAPPPSSMAPTPFPTSQAPTSASPTSASPTSRAPTTQSPTSSAPTSKAPSSASPSSAAPTSKAPSSASPSSASPTSKTPTSKAPSSASPTSKSPTSKQPTSLAPSSLAPTQGTSVGGTFAPTSLSPTSLSPTQVVPTSNNPTSVSPTSLSPTSNAPSSSTPTSKSPSSASPTSKSPSSAAPTSANPTSASPTSKAPTSLSPTSASPTSVAPTSGTPTSRGPTQTRGTAAPTVQATSNPVLFSSVGGVGGLAGIIIACIVGAVAAGLLLIWYAKRKKSMFTKSQNAYLRGKEMEDIKRQYSSP